MQAKNEPLEVLSPPAEPNGFRRPSQTPDEPSLLDLRVEFLGSTLEEIHFASSGRSDEATEKAREGLTEGDYVIAYQVLYLVGRGYTLEQALTGIFIGDVDLDGFFCFRLKDEQPQGVAIAGALSGCPNLKPADNNQPTEDEVATGDSAPAPEQSVPQSADELGFEPGTFTGSFDESFDMNDGEGQVLIERVEFVAGDTLTGTLEFLAEGPGVFGGAVDGDDLACFYLSFELTDVSLVDPSTGQFSGTGQGGGDLLDNACPTGGPPPITELLSVPVTAQVDGDTLTVTVGEEGDDLTLVATRVES